MAAEVNLPAWVAAWLAIAVVVILRHQRRADGVGLLLAYVVSFGVQHWLACALYLLPWYRYAINDFSTLGLRQSVFAIGAFSVGAELASRLPRLVADEAHGDSRGGRALGVPPRITQFYLIVGVILYSIVPLARSTPSATALAATGSSIAVAAIGLKCWNSWQAGPRWHLWSWLMVSATFPPFTVVTQGFLGYGFAATLVLFSFVSAFYRPRWKQAVASMVLAYVGLSVYVTVIRDRGDIRALVWSGADLESRLGRSSESLAAFEWFDPTNIDHLDRVEMRLDQNQMVGAAVAWLDRGAVDYAGGSTVWDAALAIVPRAIWAEKTIISGGSELATRYTGITFDKSTSVAIGPVMESYINFGTLGVCIGFLFFGAVIAAADRLAAIHLRHGDEQGFLRWYLPVLPLLQLGTFAEATASAAAALLVLYTLNWVLVRLWGRRPRTQRSADATVRPEVSV